MKNLFILVAAVLMTASVSAHTPTASDSWSTIKSHFNKVTFNEPSVRLDNAGSASMFFMCKDGEELRTKKMISKCVAWSRRGGDRDRVCTQEEKFYGVAALEGTRERCTRYRRQGRDGDRVCVSYETYDYTLALSRDIDVHAVKRGNNDRNDRMGRKLFTKTLSIEDCE